VGDISSSDLDREPPTDGYLQTSDGVEVTATLLNQLIISENKNVLLVSHSSGGFVATASATPYLQGKHRKTHSLFAGAIGVFNACAFVVSVLVIG
jgi:hypothetical protein